MRIGVIGIGMVGGTLGRRWATLGGETPRPCSPGRIVPAYWGVSTVPPWGAGPGCPMEG
ncbi:MAG TPA: hypothetical protein VI669_04710 [Vicinamibacteria bacterium]